QPPAGELVEPPDAGGRLGQRGPDRRRRPRRVHRRRHWTSRVALIKLVAMTLGAEGIRAAPEGALPGIARVRPMVTADQPASHLEPGAVARVHRAVEPLHSHTYFAPEHDERFSAIGLRPGRMSYFA